MGRKQNNQIKGKQFKKGNISKSRGQHKNSKNNFRKNRENNPRQSSMDKNVNKRYGNNNSQKYNPNKNNRSQQNWDRDNNATNSLNPKFNNNKKLNKTNKPNNLGQYSKLVGKSLFQIVPQGMNDKEDKFAALNNGEQEQYQSQQNLEQNDAQQYQEEYQNDAQEGQEVEDQDEQDNQEIGQQIEEQGDNYQNDQYPDQQAENQNQEAQKDQQEQFQYQEQQQQQQQNNQNQQNQQNIEEENNQNDQIAQQHDQQQDKNMDISVVNLKIQQTLQILMNLPKLGEGRSRKYFINKLKAYLHRYYGYNYELIDHFLNFLNPTEMVQFFQANQTQRPLTIRTNTLKTRRKQLAQALIQRGVNLDPLAQWSKVGIKIYETKVPIGATPQYLAGYYMLQSASSFLPVLALDPQMNQKILDMASAPGGKTSYIAQLMKNTGAIFANDLKKDRLKALQFNMYRLGITNTVVTCRDGRKYPQIFPNTFDRVLLDAPCTGLGIISKDHSIKSNRVLMDIYKNSHVQKQLLLAAIDCTKVGGVIVYSTCSVSPLQNEQVINYALKKRHVKIIDIDDLVEVGDPGLIKFIQKRYHVDLKKTKRIYPHVHNMDGFYLGKLVKIANGKKQTNKQEQEEN